MNAAINTTQDLKTYFFEELNRLSALHHLLVEQQTISYLSNLLYQYRRSENLYDFDNDRRTLTPLAEYYRLSIEAESEHERRMLLRKLGDVALFISSLYEGSLRRKPVGLDYYQSMGEGAYGTLASAASNKDSGLQIAFGQLAEQFESIVSLIANLSAKQDTNNNTHAEALLDKVMQWEKSGCPKLKAELQAQGVYVGNGGFLNA